MSDSQPNEPSQAALTAGALLRQARVAKGLHIAALATSIKVAPRKLELLESDRFDELPGVTFTRALAQTVCRSLKIDAGPVLALLPQLADQGLSQMRPGLNAPFRDRPGRRVPSDFQFLKNPVVLGAALLLVASVALYLLPAGWLNDVTQGVAAPTEPGGVAVTPALPPVAASTPESVTSVIVENVQPDSAPLAQTPASLPAVVDAPQVAPAASAPVAAPATGALLLRASAESWVEVIDGRGAPLISRMLQAGESVGLDGVPPLRLKIGNAAATQVSFKGKAVELTPTRDNVAKLELR